jgi:hypothetical protein
MTEDAEEGIFREWACGPAILFLDCEKNLSFLMVNMICIPQRDEKIGIKKKHASLGVFVFQHLIDEVGGDFHASFFQMRSLAVGILYEIGLWTVCESSLLNFSAKSRLSERTEGDFTLRRNSFCLDHQLIRQFQCRFHMGDNMVLRAGVKAKNPTGHPPAMLGSLLSASAGFGFCASCENYEIFGYTKNFSKGIPPDPMIRGVDWGVSF